MISLGGNGTHSVKALELYHESFMKANEGINPATLGKSILLSENVIINSLLSYVGLSHNTLFNRINQFKILMLKQN